MSFIALLVLHISVISTTDLLAYHQMYILNESLYYYAASYKKFVILSNRTHNNVIFKIHKIVSVILLSLYLSQLNILN